MKKLLSLLMAAVMLCSVCGFAFAEDTALPQAGDQVNGFTVTDVRRFELIGADMITYVHDQTGAIVVHLSNNDTNRVFDITFRTPTLDNKGIPHVFEHATLGGSAKYPSASLFFNMLYQTYNTYMNAATYNVMTTYPVASLSEEQLLKYADFYTDSCFNPMIYENEDLFREEAWRYVMATPEDDLTIAGTVYSEMQGSNTLSAIASLNFEGTLFPGAANGKSHGGLVSDIPTMTWEDLKNYHTAYYHPSNSLTILYGKLDHADEFLSLLNGYFSDYEKKDFDIEAIRNAGYTPIAEPVTAVFDYPYAEGADVSKNTVIYYGLVCENVTAEEALALDYLTTLLNDTSSNFQQTCMEYLPGATVSCYVTDPTPELAVYFTVSGVDPEDAEIFKQLCDAGIADVIANGFDAEAVDAIDAATRMDILLATESSSIGVDIIPTIAYYWSTTGDLYYYMNYVEALDQFSAIAMDGSMQAVSEKYLLNNARTALCVTRPVAGLAEEQEAQLADELAQVKAAMTEEEINAIVEYTNREDAADDSSEYIRQLTAVTVENLPEEKRVFDIEDTTDETGLRHVYVNAAADGIGETTLLLDASGLDQDQLHYFKLFTDVLGVLNTASHNAQQIAALSNRYLYNGVIRVSVMEAPDGGVHPYLRSAFIALDDDIEEGYDLIRELIYTTDFSDVDTLKGFVSRLKTSLRSTISNDCYAVELYRVEGASDPVNAYFSYVTYVDYYNFLCATEALLESDPDAVVSSLNAIRDYFNNSTNAVTGYVGGASGRAENDRVAAAFLSTLDAKPIEKKEYTFDTVQSSEAMIVDSSVAFNMVFATWEQMGLEKLNGACDAITAYVSDRYLYPLLRDQYGVYSVFCAADDIGLYIITYRDPNVAESFNVLDMLGEMIAQDVPTQETLDGYILSSYSVYATSSGELTDGFTALLNHIGGQEQTETVQYMAELKALTPELFMEYAPMFAAAVKNGTRATSGSRGLISANADLYENILNPFSVTDPSEAGYTDIAEDDPYYEYVMYALENAFVSAKSETETGAKEQVTLGDMACAMSIVGLGEAMPADEAISTLAQFGILPMDAADAKLCREELCYYMVNFCYACGIPVESGDISAFADAADVTPGIEGEIGWAVEVGLFLPEGDQLLPQEPALMQDLCYMMYALTAE